MTTYEQALAEYQAMPARTLRAVLLLEYRCPRGCPLLHVWNSPQGRLYCLPRYRLSPTKATTETTESARRKRTEDGLRVFRARAGSFDELLADYSCEPTAGLSMNCDHLRNVFVAFDQLGADADRGRPGRAYRPQVSPEGNVGR